MRPGNLLSSHISGQSWMLLLLHLLFFLAQNGWHDHNLRYHYGVNGYFTSNRIILSAPRFVGILPSDWYQYNTVLFTSVQRRRNDNNAACSSWSLSSMLLYSNNNRSRRDEEMAQLEIQLQRLRDEVAQEESNVSSSLSSSSSSSSSARKQRQGRGLQKVPGKDMLLSESDLFKEKLLVNDRTSSGGSGNVNNNNIDDNTISMVWWKV
jgi:hypothetical protein